MFFVRADLNFLKDFRPSQSLFLKLFPNLATFRPGVLPWLFVPAFRPGFLFRLLGLASRFGLQISNKMAVYIFTNKT